MFSLWLIGPNTSIELTFQLYFLTGYLIQNSLTLICGCILSLDFVICYESKALDKIPLTSKRREGKEKQGCQSAMEWFWLWAPFKQLQYLWKNNLTNFIEICRSPEVGQHPFWTAAAGNGVSPPHWTDSLDPARISPVTFSHANTVSSLLLSCDHPSPVHPKKILSDPGIKPFPGSKVYLIVRLGALHEICVLAVFWNCSLLDFHSGRVWACDRSKEVFVYQIH